MTGNEAITIREALIAIQPELADIAARSEKDKDLKEIVENIRSSLDKIDLLFVSKHKTKRLFDSYEFMLLVNKLKS